MIVSFRQGIISYPTTGGVQQFLIPNGNGVTLTTSNGIVDVTFAHRTSDYLHTEASTISNAWPNLPAATTVWLYWDLNNLTAIRTFGFTDIMPSAQPTAPQSPTVDQHWFDTRTNIMQVWTGSRWQEKIRAFAAQYDTGARTFTSISVNSNIQRFDGTQVGIQGTPTAAGRIIVDNSARPILNQSKEFFTTEDEFFTNGSPINTIRLEANILQAAVIETVAAYQVVTFTTFGRVGLATYHSLQTTAIAMAVQSITSGDVGSFVIQGVVTNPSWSWTSVGAKLWVSTGGMLVDYDPHTTDAVSYPQGKAPVARVISPTSIIFDQGLGEKGDKGDSALANGGVGDASTQFVLGKVKLSHPPVDPGSPYAVETSDPRMYNAREPLQHTQPATDILPVTFGSTINGTLQDTLQNIDSIKLNKTGDAMTGMLSLSANPTMSMHAVPKQYADTFVPRSFLANQSATGIATLDSTGRIPASQLPQISITDTFVVSNKVDLIALNAQTGDIAVVTNEHTTYILRGNSAPVLTDWEELLTKPDGILRIDVVSPSPGLSISTNVGDGASIDSTGTSGVQSGTITVNLANDLLAIETLTGTGIAHRVGQDTWEVKQVDLSNSVTNTLPIEHGGTGLAVIYGYMKGDGTSVLNTSLTIPGADILGPVGSSYSAPWSGITNTPATLGGYGILDAYTQNQTAALTWNWSALRSTPTTLAGYGITNVYSKTEIDASLALKAKVATTLEGYGITDAALATHNHTLDLLTNVNTTTKTSGDVLSWNGTNWSALTIGNASIPPTLSNKTLDNTNTINVVDSNFTIQDNADTTKRAKFEASGISVATTRTLTLPNADGTIALTNGTGATGNWNITAAAATIAPWNGVSGTPTTIAGYGITDAYTKLQTNNLNWPWAQLTSVPTSIAGFGIADAYTKADTNILTWNWSAIRSTPTTLTGYGITDVYTKTEIPLLTWNWTSIRNTPTTLSGYGITDAAVNTHNHDATYVKLTQLGDTVATLGIDGYVKPAQLPAYVHTHTFAATGEIAMLNLPANQGDIVIRSDIATTFILVNADPTSLANWATIVTPASGSGTVTSIDIIPPTAGIAITGGPIASSGAFSVTLTDDLLALESLTTVGIVRRTSSNVWSAGGGINLSSNVEVSGTLPIGSGGTGATTAAAALLSLGATPLNGTGVSGSWNINITGTAANATAVADGVYTTSAYADPTWITALDPQKVVSTWTGSTYITTVSPSLDFGDIATISNGMAVSSSTSSLLVHEASADIHSSAKYLMQIKVDATGDINFVELYTSIDGADNIYFQQTGPAFTALATFAGIYDSVNHTFGIQATPLSSAPMTYKFNVTLIAA